MSLEWMRARDPNGLFSATSDGQKIDQKLHKPPESNAYSPPHLSLSLSLCLSPPAGRGWRYWWTRCESTSEYQPTYKFTPEKWPRSVSAQARRPATRFHPTCREYKGARVHRANGHHQKGDVMGHCALWYDSTRYTIHVFWWYLKTPNPPGWAVLRSC